MINFRKAILNEMSKKGMSRAELARQTGYSKNHISSILNDDSSMRKDINSIRALIKIAKALDISVWRLVKKAELI